MPCAPENIRTFKIRQQLPLQQNQSDQSTVSAAAAVSSPSPRFIEKRVWLWERIESALSVPLHNAEDVATALRRYHRSIPNSSNKSLPVLVYTLETLMTPEERNVFLEKTLPVIQTLATDVGRYVTAPLPLLTRHANYSLSLSQLQVAALLASAFFATFPPRRAVQSQSADAEGEFPSINFIELFGCPEEDETRLKVKSHKLRCILNYFDRIAKESN
jgi:poly(ADP-ribose) glycohydrolase